MPIPLTDLFTTPSRPVAGVGDLEIELLVVGQPLIVVEKALRPARPDRLIGKAVGDFRRIRRDLQQTTRARDSPGGDALGDAPGPVELGHRHGLDQGVIGRCPGCGTKK